MAESKEKEIADPIAPGWGFGYWNVFLVLEFVLAMSGYINLNVWQNALFMAFVAVPVGNRVLRIARNAVASAAAALLLYGQSWLPGIDSLQTNINGILGFSAAYMLELAVDFINWQMIGWVAAGIVFYGFVRNFLRVAPFVIGYFLCMFVWPLADGMLFTQGEQGAAQNGNTLEAVADNVPQVNEQEQLLDKWYRAFIDYETARKANIPNGLSEKDTPFDILVLNVCSLSNDDLRAANLDGHEVFSKFNIRFDHFNSATSYSGPATLRLLNAACGQPGHGELYSGRRTECEIFNRLSSLGFAQHLFMDHKGEYDDYLTTLRDKAGLTAPLRTMRYPVRYIGFDDEAIYDDLSVLRHWMRTTARDKTNRSVSLVNLISLHDGNRLPRHGRSEPFAPRAKKLLTDLQTFIRELERSRRKVMLIVVPEHGAAVRGDRVQAARLRDIPSMQITEVPAMVRFFGIRGLPKEPLHVTGNTSYLALAELIGNVLRTDFFGKSGNAAGLEELVAKLPETDRVSENAQATVVEYKNEQYLRINDGAWKQYPK